MTSIMLPKRVEMVARHTALTGRVKLFQADKLLQSEEISLTSKVQVEKYKEQGVMLFLKQ